MAPPKGSQYAKGHGFGRPKVWTKERIEEAAHHLAEHIQAARESDKIFWWKDWAFDYGIMPSRCAVLAKESDIFAAAYKEANEIQEWQIVKGAVYKKFSSNFCQFFLINQHRGGWHTKVETANDTNLPKISFEVNYVGDKNTVEVLPKAIPTQCAESSGQGSEESSLVLSSESGQRSNDI